MVIVERKRTPNKNKQFTELHNIGNENCPPWMSCTIVRVFILKAHILFHSIQVEFEKENLGFSFSNSTNRVLKYRTFWPSQNTNRRKENREFENCDKKLPMPSHHCVITVSPLWQKSDRNIQKPTYFPLALLGALGGIHGCKTPTCVFSFARDPLQRKHTQA